MASLKMDASDILKSKVREKRSLGASPVELESLSKVHNEDGTYEEDDGLGYLEDDDGRDVENDKLIRQHVTHGFHLVEGEMGYKMEDYIVAKNKEVNGCELGLYAIFDGHGGRDVAEYLQNHLFERILKEPDFFTSPKAAIKRAYRDIDNEISKNIDGSRGSTAVTAILINGEKLIVANVGDSRAILCRNGAAKAIQITVDHEPQKEREMVERRGGFVIQMPGDVPRVDGKLAMTRAFGDESLKEHITAEPDTVIEMIDADTEFIILASDGVWKVMSNQEAFDCIKGLSNAQEASKKLVEEALRRESYDDISCIVVMFR
ncbi:probable protein phosphatase 2C 39 isoform X2 [Diospyros lotus]|uniref:probable protein phosphatase 2C 39 isoform X2 n=1 Tax=Diospyros lotus TaxID=55363 RepID=UPI00225731BE|nr:probable protein phosphatase 2C 39 isoform X2 [Diospyros lotus]